MTAYRCNLQQNANEGCNSCASLAGPGLVLSFIVSFIVCFIVVVVPPLGQCDLLAVHFSVQTRSDQGLITTVSPVLVQSSFETIQ